MSTLKFFIYLLAVGTVIGAAGGNPLGQLTANPLVLQAQAAQAAQAAQQLQLQNGFGKMLTTYPPAAALHSFR